MSPVDHLERLERDDLVTFINACNACTRQAEFYSDAKGQGISIEFLHQYVLGNYRRLYGRTLFAGINQFNRGQIIAHLLAAGAPGDPQLRTEEGELMLRTLLELPPQRALRLLDELRRRRINNRRTRALIRSYLTHRMADALFVLKYRNKIRTVAAHAHLNVTKVAGGEARAIVWGELEGVTSFGQPLYESFRRASVAGEREAVFALPLTVAEGFAARYDIKRAEMLERLAERMSAGERLRAQTSAARAGVGLELELERTPPTQLATLVLSLPRDERAARHEELEAALERSCRALLGRAPLELGKVALVLDNSWSASGSSEKKSRPLAVALASVYLLSCASSSFSAHWISPPSQPLLVEARGTTRLAEVVLDALEERPDWVVIVSDGWENDPPFAAAELIELYQRHIDVEQRTHFVHANPVFDANNFQPKPLTGLRPGVRLPVVGIRGAEDWPTLFGFLRFATGEGTLAELEEYLELRTHLEPRTRGGTYGQQ